MGTDTTSEEQPSDFDIHKKDLIGRGAEAEIWRAGWFGREVVVKKRVQKGYRLDVLDRSLRKSRIRKEARLMRKARQNGVPVPIIYDVDEENTTLIMEYFDGERVMDSIEAGEDVDLVKIGRVIGKLHDADITHGDLTTSNILYDKRDDSYCFIDFSLGERPSSTEDMGVDIHLLREALVSVHEDALDLYEKILSGYREEFQRADEVLERVKKIEKRGRYQ